MSTTLVSFASDPLLRWMLPEAHPYLGGAPGLEAFCGGAIDCGTAYRTEDFEGVAFWHAPGRGPDEDRLMEFFSSAIAEDRLSDVGKFFEKMDEYHPKGECWYLPVIGVDPAHQGRGLGAALLKHALRIIDEEGLPAYLEASSPRNAALYERHGFEVIGKIQVGNSPIISPMLRSPKHVA